MKNIEKCLIKIYILIKPIASLSELKNAVTCIDNDRIGQLPNLIAASRNKLYSIKNKNKTHK